MAGKTAAGQGPSDGPGRQEPLPGHLPDGKAQRDSPAQPPRRTVAITYQGIRTTLSGKTYAILEVSDSKLGASNHFLQEGEALPCGITIKKMSEGGLGLSDKSGNELGDLPYGTTKIVTMEGE